MPISLQKSFSIHEGSYNLKGKINFNLTVILTTRKGFCVSVSEVRLWDSFTMELKHCPNMSQFKKRYITVKRYMDEGGVW